MLALAERITGAADHSGELIVRNVGHHSVKNRRGTQAAVTDERALQIPKVNRSGLWRELRALCSGKDEETRTRGFERRLINIRALIAGKTFN